MEIRDLKTFVTVASLLHFNRAGMMLHAAQSTVSARIQALEQELGVRLFDRLGRRVVLTGAGKQLLDYARRILDTEEEARAWVGGESTAKGVLTARIPESLCVYRMSGVLPRFRSRFPNVRTRFLSSAHDGLGRELRHGETDVAFLLAEGVESGDLRVECLGVEPLAAVLGLGHALAARDAVFPADFKGETLLVPTADCSYRRMVERALAEAAVAPAAVLEFGSEAAVKRHVAGGLGIAVLPAVTVAEEVREGRLRAPAWGRGEWEAAVLMLWHKDKWLSPVLTAFMDLCREHLMADAATR